MFSESPWKINIFFRITLEKDAELDMMRLKKREERDFFKKMETGELDNKKKKDANLLIGKLKPEV